MIGQALTAVRVSRHLLCLWVAPLAVRPNLSFHQRNVLAVIYPIALGAARRLNCQRWYIARRRLLDD
jgi:hypothetical protein